jgi:hypothetical protein
MHGEDLGAGVCIGERVRDRHLAAQRWVCRLELNHLETCSFVKSFTKRPWNVSVCAVVLPVPVGASYVSEMRNEPPSRGSNACTWRLMHVEFTPGH